MCNSQSISLIDNDVRCTVTSIPVSKAENMGSYLPLWKCQSAPKTCHNRFPAHTMATAVESVSMKTCANLSCFTFPASQPWRQGVILNKCYIWLDTAYIMILKKALIENRLKLSLFGTKTHLFMILGVKHFVVPHIQLKHKSR